ncbi:hypothetical protein HF673_07780 [Acidithiobacillus thiooxidans]|uniref:Uncharacterized protein n=1 Tax=Acidithiobacillus thiooxidans TaxID=930 RepID=A0A1C2JEF3_ACITH|nr:hypothetical protein [Acidithiobacillus thiooxidans]MBU2835664.1 hypothetical protein [Acidithiobacillus thiooxidans]OCX74006.1 hypothetical protein A6M23_07105 [Acidithiobacillus thiooxidans]OCX86564.1 hypothetical protein A6P08_05475 [Acidithiobacillus thiooxidans]
MDDKNPAVRDFKTLVAEYVNNYGMSVGELRRQRPDVHNEFMSSVEVIIRKILHHEYPSSDSNSTSQDGQDGESAPLDGPAA